MNSVQTVLDDMKEIADKCEELPIRLEVNPSTLRVIQSALPAKCVDESLGILILHTIPICAMNDVPPGIIRKVRACKHCYGTGHYKYHCEGRPFGIGFGTCHHCFGMGVIKS